MNISKNLILDSTIKILLIVVMIFCSGFAMVQYGRFASRIPVIQSNKEGVIVLAAADAEILGVGPARLEDYAGQRNIGYWNSMAQSLRMSLRAENSGTYELQLTYSLPAGQKTKFRITVGDRQVDCTITGRGAWDHWQQGVIGEIELDANQADLLITPLNTFGQKGIMNFCNLTLTPISK